MSEFESVSSFKTQPPRALAVVAGQAINVARMDEAVRLCADDAEAGRGFTLFTMNLDHVVKLRSDPEFARIYRAATYVTADGAPIVWLARKSAPQMTRTTGADLVEPLCAEAARRGVAVHFFGASDRTLTRAKVELERRYPGLVVAGMEAPRMGFDPRSSDADRAGDAIKASGARICFVALGAPKQEVFSERMAQRHPGVGFVCIGAALDFIAGEKPRAPVFFQNNGLEWAWRLGSEPSRMAGRYARCAGVFASLLLAAQTNALFGR
jgi:exopolysaccharide biosynthesis WecB/TagA/CpsF family protein